MKSEYGFDGRTLAVIAAGLCVIMFLTFAAGVVTGIALWTPTRKELAALKEHGAAPPPVAVAAAAAPPPHAEAPAAGPAPAPTPSPAAPAPQPEATRTPEATPQPAMAPAATAPAATAPAPAPSPAENTDLFSLQLGSFLDVKNARQLQTDLKERGYNSIIFTALDSEQREWHVVRIGGFKTMASAAHAAADFSGKERIPAFVRRSDRL